MSAFGKQRILSAAVVVCGSVAFGLAFPAWTAESPPERDFHAVDTSGTVPSDAVVIFDGTNTEMLVSANGGPCNWPVKDGAVIVDRTKQPRQQGLWTKLHFRDAQIHAEFMVPPKDEDRYDGNSGLYLHGLFELQIIDSHDSSMPPMRMTGSLYGFRPPLVNASRPRGQWQSIDIVFKAPRRNSEGEPVEAGSVTALLNGVLIQDGTTFTKHVSRWAPLYFLTTPYAIQIRESLLKTECGPLQLQDHEAPVRFRNIWIRPLDDKAFVFEPEEKE